MYPYIVCTCGCCLGDSYDAIKTETAARNKEYYAKRGIEIDPKNYDLDPTAERLYGDILDKYFIMGTCCRMRMLTQVMFYDKYYEHIGTTQ